MFAIRKRVILLSLTVCLSGTGCRIPGMFRAPAGPQSPTVFYGAPTLDQIIQVVNANTAQVNQLQTTNASLSVTGVPALQCDMAMERPLRFRMSAGTRVTGSELDLGSNDNLFWFWAKRNEEPAIYFARHSEFRNAAAAQIMPVPPNWIIDAIGLVQLANDGSTTGPFPQGNGRIEVRSRSGGPSGELNRSIVIDDQRGFVLEQRVFDVNGQLLAMSVTSDHYFDSASGVTLPRQIDIQLPPAQLAFSIRASGYTVNQLSADGLQLWSMPQKDGFQMVDLARLPGMAAPQTSMSATPLNTTPMQGTTMFVGDGNQSTSRLPDPSSAWPAQSNADARGSVSQASNYVPLNGTVPGTVIRQQSWRRQFGWW